MVYCAYCTVAAAPLILPGSGVKGPSVQRFLVQKSEGKLDADLRSEIGVKVSDTDLEEVATRSRKEVAAVRKEVDNTKKDM